MAREVTTTFHHNGAFLRKVLDDMRWNREVLAHYHERLSADGVQPESVFLDFFVNGFTTPAPGAAAADLIWWRERMPKVTGGEWFSGAVGYARAMNLRQNPSTLLVDFWERDLRADGTMEALALAVAAQQNASLPIVWLLWSDTVLQDWQQEGIGNAAKQREKLQALLDAINLKVVEVPVTDPLAVMVAAQNLGQSRGGGTELLMLPSFGNDKLVHANWQMKAVSRIEQGLEALN